MSILQITKSDFSVSSVVNISENAAKDIVWPLTDIIKAAEEKSWVIDGTLAEAIDRGATRRNELNNVDINDIDTEIFRPPINIPIKSD
ncbi:MAG: hypothetical protein LBE18_06880 [Planctomycetaceae bacterium]|jgi:hypothetical protein|nr:hypothetical protein [Planctomycetaceae bacterium]